MSTKHANEHVLVIFSEDARRSNRLVVTSLATSAEVESSILEVGILILACVAESVRTRVNSFQPLVEEVGLRVLDLYRDKKIVGENRRREIGGSLVTAGRMTTLHY